MATIEERKKAILQEISEAPAGEKIKVAWIRHNTDYKAPAGNCEWGSCKPSWLTGDVKSLYEWCVEQGYTCSIETVPNSPHISFKLMAYR